MQSSANGAANTYHDNPDISCFIRKSVDPDQLPCQHIQSIEVDEGLYQKWEILPHLIEVHVCFIKAWLYTYCADPL